MSSLVIHTHTHTHYIIVKAAAASTYVIYHSLMRIYDKGIILCAGAVYMPHEPLLLQSLRNPFVFRCVDGVMIDGNHRGLSRWIYK